MLSYFCRGKLDHPPLVFLHGFLGTKEDWEEVVTKLQDDFCCYAFDLPGHGESNFESNILGAIEKALQNLSLLEASFVGYSLGGRLCLQLQKNIRGRTILIGSHPGLQEEEKNKRWQKDFEWIQMLKSSSMEDFLISWYSQEIFSSLKRKKNLFKKLLEKRKKENPKNLAKVLEVTSLAKQSFIQPDIASTFFLYGEEDLKFEALYHTLFPNIRKTKIPRSGHAPHLENPGDCAYAIRDSLKN